MDADELGTIDQLLTNQILILNICCDPVRDEQQVSDRLSLLLSDEFQTSPLSYSSLILPRITH